MFDVASRFIRELASDLAARERMDADNIPRIRSRARGPQCEPLPAPSLGGDAFPMLSNRHPASNQTPLEKNSARSDILAGLGSAQR
jgi:hypothetical protein